jgi:hypothetical protein
MWVVNKSPLYHHANCLRQVCVYTCIYIYIYMYIWLIYIYLYIHCTCMYGLYIYMYIYIQGGPQNMHRLWRLITLSIFPISLRPIHQIDDSYCGYTCANYYNNSYSCEHVALVLLDIVLFRIVLMNLCKLNSRHSASLAPRIPFTKHICVVIIVTVKWMSLFRFSRTKIQYATHELGWRHQCDAPTGQWLHRWAPGWVHSSSGWWRVSVAPRFFIVYLLIFRHSSIVFNCCCLYSAAICWCYI